jgi:hypothetical protein
MVRLIFAFLEIRWSFWNGSLPRRYRSKFTYLKTACKLLKRVGSAYGTRTHGLCLEVSGLPFQYSLLFSSLTSPDEFITLRLLSLTLILTAKSYLLSAAKWARVLIRLSNHPDE